MLETDSAELARICRREAAVTTSPDAAKAFREMAEIYEAETKELAERREAQHRLDYA
jgi:hypothetical protein